MTFAVADRVLETSANTGTGTFTLQGSQTGYVSFVDKIGANNTCYYAIVNQSVPTEWEIGLGTVGGTSGAGNGTLARTSIFSSSTGSVVSFSSGTKNVFVTYPATTSVYLDANNAVNLANSNSISVNNSIYPTTKPSLNLDFANSKQLDPRVTFSRLSTATYYDGKSTAMAEQNLLIGSQTIGIAGWILLAGGSGTAPIATANYTMAPDGSSSATRLVASLNGGTTASDYSSCRNGANISTLAGLTYSIWAISNTGSSQTILLNLNQPGSTLITVSTSWTRITAYTSGVSGSYDIGIRGSYGTSSSMDITVWGAQLEQRSSATAYTPTTTTPITNYIPQLMTAPAGVARFDHDPLTGKSLGLLIEESRANYIGASSATITPSIAPNVKITLNAAVSPLGTQTALLYSPLAAGNALVQVDTLNSALLIVGNTYTFSCYIKNNNFDLLTIYMGGSESTDRTGIYVNTNTIPFTTSTYSPYQSGTGAAPTNITYTSAGNGWYRVAFTFIATNTNASPTFRNNLSSIINGFSGVFIDGWQTEAGSFATSYIPTTTGSVTRAADQASMTGVNFSSWYNQDQGTLYVDGDSFASAPGTLANISDGGLSNYFRLGSGYGNINDTSLYASSNASGKSALSTSGLQMSYSKNGAILSSAITTKLVTNNLLCLGNILPTFSGSGYNLNGHIHKISYYPKALTATELKGLTS